MQKKRILAALRTTTIRVPISFGAMAMGLDEPPGEEEDEEEIVVRMKGSARTEQPARARLSTQDTTNVL